MNRRSFLSRALGIIAAVYAPSMPWSAPEPSFMPVKITPGDARFIESQAFTVEEVARWFALTEDQIFCNMT